MAGVGDLYQGALARRRGRRRPWPAAALTARATCAARCRAMRAADQRADRPRQGRLPAAAGRWRAGGGGGVPGAAARSRGDSAPAAGARAGGRGALARQGGGDPDGAADGADAAGGSLPALPASTTFATLDRDGNAVVCALSMNNLFGTGRIAPGHRLPAGRLAGRRCRRRCWPPALAWNDNMHAFRAEVGGSGQDGGAAGGRAARHASTRCAEPGPRAMPASRCPIRGAPT